MGEGSVFEPSPFFKKTMKHIILSLCAFCLLALSAGAQSAQADFEASLPDTVKYVMPAFGPGNILYKDGGFSRGSFNICTVDNTLRYIDTDESEKVLADPSQVESVSISGVLFLHTQNMYLGVVGDYDDILLCVLSHSTPADPRVSAVSPSSTRLSPPSSRTSHNTPHRTTLVGGKAVDYCSSSQKADYNQQIFRLTVCPA